MRLEDNEDHKRALAASAVYRKIKNTNVRLWQQWTEDVGPTLEKIRAEAIRLAKSNGPYGSVYATKMSALLKEYGFDDANMHQKTRADILNVMEELHAVQEWRRKQKNPERINHPTTAWEGFKRSKDHIADLIERGEYKKPVPKPDETGKLRRQLEQERERSEELVQERDLARMERDRLAAEETDLADRFTAYLRTKPEDDARALLHSIFLVVLPASDDAVEAPTIEDFETLAEEIRDRDKLDSAALFELYEALLALADDMRSPPLAEEIRDGHQLDADGVDELADHMLGVIPPDELPLWFREQLEITAYGQVLTPAEREAEDAADAAVREVQRQARRQAARTVNRAK